MHCRGIAYFPCTPRWMAARTAGAGIAKGVIRVTLWGAVTMGLTMGVGVLIGKAA